jgi:hypothetical protein
VPTQTLEPLLILLLTLVFLGLLAELGRFDNWAVAPKTSRRPQRPLRPRTPDDCPTCRAAAAAQPAAITPTVVPYLQRKSSRGRKKTIDTRGQACANPECDYHAITDPAIHALVGYTCTALRAAQCRCGHHGIHTCTALARSASAGVIRSKISIVRLATASSQPADTLLYIA